MQNKLEFVTNWFGGLNVGATPAFVNNQLTGKQLLHCLKISDSEFIIADGSDELLEALFDVKDDVKNMGLRILVDDKNAQLPRNVFEINPFLLAERF